MTSDGEGDLGWGSGTRGWVNTDLGTGNVPDGVLKCRPRRAAAKILSTLLSVVRFAYEFYGPEIVKLEISLLI